MTRWPDGPPPRVPTPRSPSAHAPDATCPTCRDCPSCEGGTAVLPDAYRITPTGVAICTRCNGSGTTCLNLTRDLENTRP